MVNKINGDVLLAVWALAPVDGVGTVANAKAANPCY